MSAGWPAAEVAAEPRPGAHGGLCQRERRGSGVIPAALRAFGPEVRHLGAIGDADVNLLLLAALAARAAESTMREHALELRVAELERTARLRARWEAEITGRRSASVLVDCHGTVIAERDVGQLPERVELPSDFERLVQMPDGRTLEAQWLDGDGVILWLRRRRAAVVPRLHLRLLGAGADARFGRAPPERGLR